MKKQNEQKDKIDTEALATAIYIFFKIFPVI